MFKNLISLFLLFVCIASPSLAKAENFVSVVNPIRGNDFWEMKNQSAEEVVRGEAEILKQYNLPATWLFRFDALENENILKAVEGRGEKGLFLEVTPSWTSNSGVSYRNTSSWHGAGSAFLTGYEIKDREKLIDAVFERFKNVFGSFPKTVGAWWIDSYSLNYMQEKYDISSALIVADQYTTDNYQIWGQYFSTPYYPDKKNALHPAQTLQNKIPVVISQWAPRDPLNAYGNGVYESTFSVQANDYIDYHNLDINYFKKLIEVYTEEQLNQFGSLVVGLENTYDWSKYKNEYKNQIDSLAKNKNIKVVTLKDFASWYKSSFPNLSPAHIVVADDPLGSDKKVVWFMNQYYRAGWFYGSDGSVFRDIRQYIEGEEELCFSKRCDSVNFATSATRVLDDVSFGQSWVLDSGKISDFKVEKTGEKIVINYKNEAGKQRQIEFLERDIAVDGNISSIDATILNATKSDASVKKVLNEFEKGGFKWDLVSIISKIFKFLAFLLVALLIPGLVLVSKLNEPSIFKKLFLGISVGFVIHTLIFYILSLLNLRWAFLIFIFINLLLFLKLKLFKFKINLTNLNKLGLISGFVIAAGSFFQNIPSFRNGLVYPYGAGFWGPNTHDGVWHISLINQLISSVPPQNPIFSGNTLKNYHFFYDLLVASTSFFTNIPVLDLVFRFYPILFSLTLGAGTYYLALKLFESYGLYRARIGAIFSLYFVYFAGSFGWIVEYIKQKSLGGESAFWANQSISFNLNPPFAISLIIVISIFLILSFARSRASLVIQILLVGTLVAFKAYAALLILTTFLVVGILNKNLSFFLIFTVSSVISAFLLLSNFSLNKTLFVFSPFWFVHSMIDSPDRVGWTRLTLTRIVGLETKNWFKFISAEAIGFFLFIVGNLGMRVLSLFTLFKLPKVFKNPTALFILVFTIASFAVPTLFIQSGNPWNTIQFFYYGLYTTAVVSGIIIANLYYKLPKMLAFIIFGIILILTPVNSATTATYYLGYYPHGRIDLKELEALEFLAKNESGVVLTYPYDEKLKRGIAEPWPLFAYDSTAYVSAFSKKQVFLEDIGQNQILLTDFSKRVVSSKDFFANPKGGYQFLRDNNIKYIYLPKLHKVSIEQSDKLEMIFENSEIIIYKVN